MKRLSPVALPLLFFPCAVAQMCPHDGGSEVQLVEVIKHADQPDVIYRSAAITGPTRIPALRQLSRPQQDAYTIPGAAQVSLAKLGDKISIEEIQTELNSPRGGDSIYKLLRVGTPDAISVLMTYVEKHISDISLSRNYGDYTVDPRNDIIQGLERTLPNPPKYSDGAIKPSYYETWLDWWKQNKNKPVTLSISEQVRDPRGWRRLKGVPRSCL